MSSNSMQLNETDLSTQVITREDLLNHWQGHRRLTRRVIEAFPEEALFTYSIGGMRPFAALAMEMIQIASPGIKGLVTGQWEEYKDVSAPTTKAEVLKIWDEVTQQIDALWPQIPANRFQQEELIFGMYEGTIISHIFYFIDNEIHHRGQGYVYLRSLGIEPPAFWLRD